MRWTLITGVLLLGLGLELAAQTPPPAAPVYSSTDAAPTVSLTVEERVDIFLARRNYQQAINLISDQIRARRATPGLYNRLGIANQQLTQLGPAIRNYKLAIKGSPHTADYINNLGTVYLEQRKYRQAVDEFHKAIKLDAGKAPFFVNLGAAEFSRKRYTIAFAAYRQALRLDPEALFPTTGASSIVQEAGGTDEPRYHYDLSRLFCSMGMLDDAVHQFRQAFEQHYAAIKDSLTDPVFAPLRARPEYQVLMGTAPAAGTASNLGSF